MTKDRLRQLIIRRMDGAMSEAESLELAAWAEQDPQNQEWLTGVLDGKFFTNEIAQWQSIHPAVGYQRWREGMPTRRFNVRRMVGWIAAASLLAAVVIIGVMHHERVPSIAPPPAIVHSTVMPGRNTATLTLASGRQVLLDSAGIGQLATQGNVRLTKVDSGSVAYSIAGSNNTAIVYNLLTTPRSGQYHIILPDGTGVWLNNVSSLRYPTSFDGQSNRMVFLSGEAYFEVTKDAARPFMVDVNAEKVTVLGTSFNIKAYADEAVIQTTLLSGGVEVQAGDAKVRLQPDEQARWTGSGALTLVKGIDAMQVASWKDGFFYFGRASFGEVMRQIARWYDVEVKYEGAVPKLEFGGKLDRSVPLEDLLKYLDKNEVHFRLDGKILVVLPS